MNDFLNKLGEWLKQAWVYIPAILAFISAIGLPSLVQIAKIFASAKLYLTKVSVLLKKTNETVDEVNRLLDFMIAEIDDDIHYEQRRLSASFNIKEKEIIAERIDLLCKRKERLSNRKIEKLQEEDVSKKKVKVKVKIKAPEAKSDEKDIR